MCSGYTEVVKQSLISLCLYLAMTVKGVIIGCKQAPPRVCWMTKWLPGDLGCPMHIVLWIENIQHRQLYYNYKFGFLLLPLQAKFYMFDEA